MAMRLLDLFSGIGGFSYAAEKLIGGYETVAFCEMDDFCQKILKKHWPQVPIFDDVRTLDASRLGRIDIVTGGYPCQPFSQAGKRQGEKDERHLWPEMLRIIKSCKPRYVLAENVAGHVKLGLDQVLTDLENEGYTTRAIIIPACAKNAPHRRDRVWIIGQNVADSKSIVKNGIRRETNEVADRGNTWLELERSSDRQLIRKTKQNVANTSSKRSQRGLHRGKIQKRQTQQQHIGHTSTVCEQPKERTKTVEQQMGNLADGISTGLLRHFDREPKHIPRLTSGEKDRVKKLKALGNSIVPQVAAEILLAVRVSEESD